MSQSPTIPACPLTERGRQVLQHLNLGHRDKVIARNLRVTPPTVNYHLTKLYRRLGVRKRKTATYEARAKRLASVTVLHSNSRSCGERTDDQILRSKLK